MIKIDKKRIELLFLIVLFCFAISLFNRAGYIFSALVLITVVFCYKSIHITSVEILLIIFSLSYGSIFAWYYGISLDNIILQFVGPWAAYIVGKLYIKKTQYNNGFMIFILVLAVGMFLHGVLNIIAYLKSDYFFLYKYYRQSVDFWRNELVNVKSTEMLYTFLTGIGLGIIFSRNSKGKVISWAVVLFSVFITVFLANRTLLIIFLFICLIRMFFWFRSVNVSARKKTIVASVLILGILLLLICINFNILGIGSIVNSLKIIQRFSGSELTRFDVWNTFFDDFAFLEHLFGGKALVHDSEFGYLHNTWLDI